MITIGKYNFEGPFNGSENLFDRSGVYTILDKNLLNLTIIDIGESSQVKTRIENHDRKDQWKKTAQGRIMIAVLYTPYLDQSKRIEIEKQLRDQFKPTCGER